MSRPRGEQALLDYLDRLLQPQTTVPDRPHAEPEPAPVTPTVLPVNRVKLQQLLDQVSAPVEAPAAVIASAPAVAKLVTASVPAPVSPAPETTSSESEKTNTEAGVGYSNARYRNELPARFQALIFRIDELRIALPLYLLGGILKQTKAPTPIVGRPDWLLGLLPNEPANINVVDTGRYLLGNKYRAELVEGYKYVIRIGDSDWGLACTELCATQDIGDDDIRWYDSNPNRPWLAGMIKAERCALLNSRALVEALEQTGRAA